MSAVHIRPLRKDDIEFVYARSLQTHWSYNRQMIKRLVAYEPNGCFIAHVDQKRVGHIFCIAFGKVGWIGVLNVDPWYRRQGIGTLLMKKAVHYLRNLAVDTIKLEAVPVIAELYHKLKFINEFDSLRFMKNNKRFENDVGPHVKQMRGGDLEAIAEFDSKYFGVHRSRVLHRLYMDLPECCFLSHVNSQIAGYIMFYPIEKGYRIGPWVCNPHFPQVARALILKSMQIIKCEVPLYVGTPAVNKLAIELLQTLGFTLTSKCIRMYLDKKDTKQNPTGIYSVASPEKG